MLGNQTSAKWSEGEGSVGRRERAGTRRQRRAHSRVWHTGTRGLQNEDSVVPEGCCLPAETPPGLPHSLTVKAGSHQSWSVSPAGCRSLTPPICGILQLTGHFPRLSLVTTTVGGRVAYSHFIDEEIDIQRGSESNGRLGSSERALLTPYPHCSLHTKWPPAPSPGMASLHCSAAVWSPLSEGERA